jgi:xanthine dehydrogenase accessory factor
VKFDGGPGPDIWGVLARWRSEGRRFVLLTVVEARGFTPQKPGVHMLLAAGGETAGTIGGGAIEHDCLLQAHDLLASGQQARTVRRQLTTELGMCCGGEMVVHLEVLEALPRLFVFGAGHVARPLAAFSAACGFAVHVVRAPDDVAHELATADAGEDANTYAVVTTHDHALDQRVVQELLRRELRFTGLIGSLAKQRKFALRLRARGFGDAQIARLRTPVGLAISARTAEEIAVSIVAELVAVRRGGSPERGWVPPARVAARTPEAAGGGPESKSAHVLEGGSS